MKIMGEKEENKLELKWYERILERRWAAYTMATCSAVVLYMILSNIGGIFSGIGSFFAMFTSAIYGAVIAYLINPIVNFFENKVLRKLKKEWLRNFIAVFIAFLIIATLFTLLMIVLIPSVVDSVRGIVGNMSVYSRTIKEYSAKLSDFAENFGVSIPDLSAELIGVIQNAVSKLASNMNTIVGDVKGVFAATMNFIIGVFIAIYLLADKKRLGNGLNRLRQVILTDKAYEKHTIFWARCHKILIRYICFDILDGIIIASINALFMAIVQMPYVPLISVIVGVTNLLPVFGPVIGGAIGGILLFLTNPLYALIFIIFTVILQIYDGYILKPKMFGGSMGVPPVWVLISITVGGKMFGALGIIFAIPFAAIFTFLYNEEILPWLAERKRQRQALAGIVPMETEILQEGIKAENKEELKAETKEEKKEKAKKDKKKSK